MLQSILTVVMAVLVLVALVAIILLWWQKGWFVQWLKGSMGMLLLAGAVVAVFALVDLWSYQSWQEQPLATISVYSIEPQHFDITLVDADGNERRYQLRGDQWQLDVRLLEWQGPLAFGSFKPLYRLENLSGRYLSLEQQRNAAVSEHKLSSSRWVNIGQSLQYIPWLDVQVSRVAYMPLANGAVYSLQLSSKGVEATPVNDVAEQALQGFW